MSGEIIKGVGATAQCTAASRAIESERPDRLYYDPYARLFAGENGFQMLKHFAQFRKGLGSSVEQALDITVVMVSLRTKFIDDVILSTLHEDKENALQLVILGCGFDCRAHRLFEVAPSCEVRIYEVDLPEVISYRETILPPVTTSNIKRFPIATDLTRSEQWQSLLLQNSFDPSKRTIWVLEGLIMYFEEEIVHQFLRSITRLSSPNSLIVGDTHNEATVTSPFLKLYNDEWAKWGASMIFGHDNPKALLIQHGFSLNIKISQYGDENVDYGRFPQHLKTLLNFASHQGLNMPQTFLFTARRDNTKEEDLWDYIGYYKLKSANKQLDQLKPFLNHSKIDQIVDVLSYFTEKLRDKSLNSSLPSDHHTSTSSAPLLNAESTTRSHSILDDLVNYNFIDDNDDDTHFDFLPSNILNNNNNNNNNYDEPNGVVEEELD